LFKKGECSGGELIELQQQEEEEEGERRKEQG